MRCAPLPLLRSLLALAVPWFAMTLPTRAAEPALTRLAEVAQAMRIDLQENLLPYWLKHARNPANQGFYGEVRADNTPVPEAHRGSLLTARILWTFSAAYRLDPRPEYREMADYAYRDLVNHFLDRTHGGYHWSLRADGTPESTTKQIYTQSFCLYGLSEYHRAFGSAEAKEQAVALYQLLEKHARDPRHGGYWERCEPDWSRRPSEESIVSGKAPKSQNTNLHMMEALTTFYLIHPTEQARESLRDSVRVMTTKVLQRDTLHLMLFQDDDWTPRGNRFSYGHDIEFSWLLTEALDALQDPALNAELKPLAVRMVEVTVREGLDPDGSVLGEGDPSGVVNRYKEWWAQAEAMVGYVNAYQLSGDTRHVEQAAKTWALIDRELIDHQGGEWFLFLGGDPVKRAQAAKIAFWKCPYHSGRAAIEVYRRAVQLGALHP